MKTKRHSRDLGQVHSEVINKKLSMVTSERFSTVRRLAAYINENQIPGDAVEIGCWRGGMSIYMAHALPDISRKRRWPS